HMHCEWRFTSNDPPAVTLFYRAFDPPVFFAIGSAVAVERLLDEAPLPPSVYVHIRPEILTLVSEGYQRVTTKMMQRMILREPALADFTGVETIAADDLKELVELYDSRDGKEKRGNILIAGTGGKWSLLWNPRPRPVGGGSRHTFDQPK
ncbi:MAG TPA: hypothetical protein VHY59_01170, partial [Chthoniobacterales bacterium]|nr:hypothetical protein [Chthoniobacterales bacterium]